MISELKNKNADFNNMKNRRIQINVLTSNVTLGIIAINHWETF